MSDKKRTFRTTISLPNDLRERMLERRDLNYSAICAGAIRRVLDGVEEVSNQLPPLARVLEE